MSTFNSLPVEATPLLTDQIWTGRGTLAGAERKTAFQSLNTVLGFVLGPASAVDNTLPLFNGTTGKTLKTSGWSIVSGQLRSPILTNPSGDVRIQQWGGVMTSGGQFGGGLSAPTLGLTRDIAGPSSTKLTDNWGLGYNRELVAGVPKYGFNFETVFDTSMIGGGVDGEVYLEHRIENGSGGPAAGSVVGGRLVQWNVGLPTSFAQSPSNAAAYYTSSGQFAGHVGLIGTLNFFAFQAYDAAQANRGGFSWTTTAATSGIRLVSNTGYTFADFAEWGQRSNPNDFVMVGSTSVSFSLKNTASTFGGSRGLQFFLNAGLTSIVNWENGRIGFTSNGSSNAEGLCLTAGNRVLINAGNSPTDSGDRFQVVGNATIGTASTGDTTLTIRGQTYPGLKIIGTSFPSGVDILCDSSTDFKFRINDNRPLNLMTQGQSRFNVHSTNSSYAPFNVGPSATPGTSMARVKHGVATLVAGTVTVSETTVTANSRVIAVHRVAGGTLGVLSTSNSAGVSFTITSTMGTDTSTVTWFMIEP